MKKLLIATHNPAKLEELNQLLSELLDPNEKSKIELVSLSDMEMVEDVEETGSTFEENALIKARFFHEISGLPTLADDGGLEIDYLDGAPGIKSKRWIGGVETSDQELIDYTFEQMKNVSESERGASFTVALAYIDKQGNESIAQGSTRGMIPEKPLERNAKQGFPYRQVLYLPKIGKYYNSDEMTRQEQEEYNHRKRALETLIPIIRSPKG